MAFVQARALEESVSINRANVAQGILVGFLFPGEVSVFTADPSKCWVWMSRKKKEKREGGTERERKERERKKVREKERRKKERKKKRKRRKTMSQYPGQSLPGPKLDHLN